MTDRASEASTAGKDLHTILRTKEEPLKFAEALLRATTGLSLGVLFFSVLLAAISRDPPWVSQAIFAAVIIVAVLADALVAGFYARALRAAHPDWRFPWRRSLAALVVLGFLVVLGTELGLAVTPLSAFGVAGMVVGLPWRDHWSRFGFRTFFITGLLYLVAGFVLARIAPTETSLIELQVTTVVLVEVCAAAAIFPHSILEAWGLRRRKGAPPAAGETVEPRGE